MARFRQGLQKRPIVSNKEIVDAVFLIVAGGVNTDIDIASAVDDYTGTVGTVPLGATVLGFYLESSSNNVDNIVGRTDWYLMKRPKGIGTGAFPTAGATGGHEKRALIFHETKGVFSGATSTVGGQMTRIREFIKIPKGFRRFAENDKWTIRVGSSENYSYCLKCIYKWYL